MQFQADVLGVPVIRPKVAETTALGAAYAAGLAVGFWSASRGSARELGEDKRWTPTMDAEHARAEYQIWKKAVTRTFDWVESEAEPVTPDWERLRRRSGRSTPPHLTLRPSTSSSSAAARPASGVARDAAMRGFAAPGRARATSGRAPRPVPRPAPLGRALRRRGPPAARECVAENRSCAGSPPTASRTPAACSSRRRPTTPTTPTSSSPAAQPPACRCRRSPSPRRSPASRALNPGISRAFEVPDASVDAWKLLWGNARSAPGARRASPHVPLGRPRSCATATAWRGGPVATTAAARSAHRGAVRHQRRRGLGRPDRRHGRLPGRHAWCRARGS